MKCDTGADYGVLLAMLLVTVTHSATKTSSLIQYGGNLRVNYIAKKETKCNGH